MDAPNEITAMLRAVPIFSAIPSHALVDIARLLDEVSVRAGTIIFHKGAPGDCLYIIAAGCVRVQDGERTLNDLWPCDVFGEMALLDHEQRSATVVAIEDTRLLRLDRAVFYDLLATHGEVAQGIIRVLSQHLRERLRDMERDFTYLQRMARLSAAAAALEAGVYQPASLDALAHEDDELAQLARTFQRMATTVIAREQQLQQQVQALTITVDTAKRAEQVANITETDYFRALQRNAQRLRAARGARTPRENSDNETDADLTDIP